MKYYCLNCGDRIKTLLLSEDHELDAFDCEACGARPLCFNCTLCPECAEKERALTATPPVEVAP